MAHKLTKAGETRVPLFDLLEGLDREARRTDKQEAWAKRAEGIISSIESVLGPFPALFEPDIQLDAEREVNGVIVQRLEYTSWDGDRVPAYVLIHPEVRRSGIPVPGIIALHQTANQGKDEIVGISGNKHLKYGWELADRGFVVLAPDVLTAGERIYQDRQAFQTAPFQERYPEWSMMGKMIYDHRLGLNVLQSLPYVNPDSLGAIGHSLGGYNAFLLAAFDRRVKAAVSSCGFSTFACDPNPGRWGLRPEWFSHMPKVSEYLENGTIPFEFHEAAALVAPRGFFNWSTQQDSIFPHWQAIAEGMLRVGEVYQFLEADEAAFVSLLGVGKHSFPPYAREAAYSWLERQLKQG